MHCVASPLQQALSRKHALCQTALERQDLSRTYLAHHELEIEFNIITINIIIVNIATVVVVIIDIIIIITIIIIIIVITIIVVIAIMHCVASPHQQALASSHCASWKATWISPNAG